MQSADIRQTQIAIDKILYNVAISDWNIEVRSSYNRIKSLGNPVTHIVAEMFSDLPKAERDNLLLILPKRSRSQLKEADREFFPESERQIAHNFIDKVRHLSIPFGQDNEEVTEIWEAHKKLSSHSKPQQTKIATILRGYLKYKQKKQSDYHLSHPEPELFSFEKQLAIYRIIIDWDLRPWEISCNVKVHQVNHLVLMSNCTFLGNLGISSSAAWYSNEESAVEAAAILADHAFKISNLIATELNKVELNSTRQP